VADLIFNVAKGRVAHYASLPAANDGIIALLLDASGLVADTTMRDYASLSALLAGTSNEHTLGRKTMTNVTVTIDNATDRVRVDMDDFTWEDATGANTGALLLCYDPDLLTTDDAAVIPLAKYDFTATLSTVDVVVRVPDGGWFQAT
jgi:hypothetical protein